MTIPRTESSYPRPPQSLSDSCCYSYCCCNNTENGELARTAKHKYCLKKDINLPSNGICVVYHGLCTCTSALHGRCLHRAGPRTMRHRRCAVGNDRASKWYSEKPQGMVLGSEAIFLASCHMTYKPQADNPEL